MRICAPEPQPRQKTVYSRAYQKVRRRLLPVLGEEQGWLCALCGQAMDRSLRPPHPLAPTLDHILPMVEGGTHERSNLQLVHLRCNASKGGRL